MKNTTVPENDESESLTFDLRASCGCCWHNEIGWIELLEKFEFGFPEPRVPSFLRARLNDGGEPRADGSTESLLAMMKATERVGLAEFKDGVYFALGLLIPAADRGH